MTPAEFFDKKVKTELCTSTEKENLEIINFFIEMRLNHAGDPSPPPYRRTQKIIFPTIKKYRDSIYFFVLRLSTVNYADR